MGKSKNKAAAVESFNRDSNQPQMWARDYRRASYLCAIMHGTVVLAKRVNGDVDLSTLVMTGVDQGRWACLTDLTKWAPVPADSQIAARIVQIHRDCYCSSFPDSGCDFCNGTRLPDGATEL